MTGALVVKERRELLVSQCSADALPIPASANWVCSSSVCLLPLPFLPPSEFFK